MVDDVSKLLIEGDLMDDSQRYQYEQQQIHNYLDASLGMLDYIIVKSCGLGQDEDHEQFNMWKVLK